MIFDKFDFIRARAKLRLTREQFSFMFFKSSYWAYNIENDKSLLNRDFKRIIKAINSGKITTDTTLNEIIDFMEVSDEEERI